MSNPRLIVFARYPAPGHAKTRLIPVLGTHGASLLQHRMTRQTLDVAAQFAATHSARVELRVAGAPVAMREFYPGPWNVTPQGEGPLGERLNRAIADAFAGGAGPVVTIGSDCPALAASHLAAAFDALRDHDLVLGPAVDGGYYLIGLRRPAASLFENIAWSTERVLAQTLAAAARLGLAIMQLAPLQDVDRPEDLAAAPWPFRPKRLALTGAAGALGMRFLECMPRISVVIPVLNEAASIDATLNALRQVPGLAEVIVVDCGSRDESLGRAARHGVRIVTSPCGRGTQMHAGALASAGDVLWFLHADTLPPPDASSHIAATLADPSTVAGSFQVRFAGNFASARFLTWLYRHLALLGLRYGDSGYFVKRAEYLAVGGFRPYPIFEDLDLMRRLRKRGRFARVSAVVTTSSRRFEGRPFALVFAHWTLLQILYWVGVPPAWLQHLYRHVR